MLSDESTMLTWSRPISPLMTLIDVAQGTCSPLCLQVHDAAVITRKTGEETRKRSVVIRDATNRSIEVGSGRITTLPWHCSMAQGMSVASHVLQSTSEQPTYVGAAVKPAALHHLIKKSAKQACLGAASCSAVTAKLSCRAVELLSC